MLAFTELTDPNYSSYMMPAHKKRKYQKMPSFEVQGYNDLLAPISAFNLGRP